MSKKIAILTLPLHHNFGGNLQAYALSETLKDLGCEVSVLNIQNKKLTNIVIIKNFGKNILKKIFLSKSVNFLILEAEKKKLYQNHTRFLKEKLNLTEEIADLSSLESIVDFYQFDAVVVGSDQVWRKAYTPNIHTYFLNFINGKAIQKIAYAASFGLEQWQYDSQTTLDLAKLAEDFDYISVRESDAVDLCQKYLHVDSEHVLDPTLLVAKEKYLDLAKDFQSHSKHKLFTYTLDENPHKDTLIKKIATEKKLEISRINLFKFKKSPFIENIEDAVTPHIETWLANFRDAEFIVTDSFHGMVFSIIFNKEFLVFVNKERGASRFYSLLKFLNLEERIIHDESFDILRLEKINYEKINFLISERVLQIKEKLSRVIK